MNVETNLLSDDFDIDDDELIRLALAADPNVELSPDAQPWLPANHFSPLPDWYMAPAVALRSGLRRRIVVGALIGGFIVINAFGLCVTSGFITVA